MIFYAIPVLLVAAFFIHVMAFKSERIADLFAVAAMALSFGIVAFSSVDIISGSIFIRHMGNWLAPVGIVIEVDALSLMMALLITGMFTAMGIFSMRYIRERQPEFYTLMLFMMTGMLGFVITGDLFNMYVFFEIMSVSSYALTAWTRTKESLEGAFKYLIIGSFGTSLILIGIALMYGITGSLTLADIAGKAQWGIGLQTSLALILSGLLIKSAVVPFHAWKPDATEAAIEPVGGLYSGISTAIGVYGILRILFIFGMLDFSLALVAFGVITMVTGAVMAFMQKDLRKLLAYSSISQIGYVVMAIGLGATGITAGLFHLFNNALLKIMLFMAAGIVFYHTGIKDMNRLGGLGKALPITMICFAVGALGIAGIPGINGFASKFMIYMAAWNLSPALAGISIIISAFTLAYFLKAFSTIFLGTGSKDANIKQKTPRVMLIPMVALAVICVLIGIFPEIGMAIVQPAADSLQNLSGYVQAALG